jgi:hypothetical protein
MACLLLQPAILVRRSSVIWPTAKATTIKDIIISYGDLPYKNEWVYSAGLW